MSTPHDPSKPAANSPAPFWRDARLPHVELRQAFDSRACYLPHSHPTYSIGAVDQGRSRFTGARGGVQTIASGTLVYVPPDRVHACNPEAHASWSYHMLHVDAGWLHALRAEQEAFPSGHRLEDVMLVTTPARYQAYHRLAACLWADNAVADKDAALIEFIMDSDTLHEVPALSPLAHQPVTAALQRVMDALRSEPAPNPTLAELARLAGMGRYQLLRAFRACTGMTPHAYQLNHRINLARDWLRQGASLADTAYRLGFADQSHFQRIFKARAGVPPGQFRLS